MLWVVVNCGVARADTPTPTAGTTPEATSTSAPTALPTWTPVPTVAPTAVPGSTPRAETRVRRHSGSPRVRLTATPVLSPTHTVTESARKKHHKKRKKAKPTPTATASPTPTATPALNLTAEDSVAPVTCNGPARPNAKRPFLSAPYHGVTSIVSIFDHDSPNFVDDGLTIATTGAQAVPDASHHRTDFPAYWNGSIRQYLDYDGHNGYDYDLFYQPVYAAAAGKVIFAALEYPDSPLHGYGDMVMIDHRNGYVTLYGHFSKLLVKKGQRVRRGQKIGISGNTGHSTGPHLHFTVFHNCTPTDPYGWSGTGQDPLASYKGETSSYLWRKAPAIINPLPGWPGLSSLPAVPGFRHLLLALPPTSLGATGFTNELEHRAAAVAKSLRSYGFAAHVNMLRGSVDISAAVPFSLLYRLPYAVSIEAPDTVDGAGAQVLAALARAELSSAHRRSPLGHSRLWSGYLIHLAGRTVLVGKGTKGHEVALRLPRASGRIRTERLRADPANGLYAVDLGKLSAGQYRAVVRALHGPAVRSAAPVASNASTARARLVRLQHAGSAVPRVAIVGIVLGLVGASGVALELWRRRSGDRDGAAPAS